VAVPTYDIGRRTGSRTAADKARGLLEEALGLAQRAGDRVVEAMTLHALGEQRGDLYSTYAYLRRDLSEEDLSKRTEAQPLFEQALVVATEAGYARIRIRALGNLAMINYRRGDLSASRQQAENALALARDVGDKLEMGVILVLVGCVAADQGVEFESMERMREWYASHEYAEALALSASTLRRRMLFVDGMDTSGFSPSSRRGAPASA
jgi:tetratricopeptide (TPR) repeat protein